MPSLYISSHGNNFFFLIYEALINKFPFLSLHWLTDAIYSLQRFTNNYLYLSDSIFVFHYICHSCISFLLYLYLIIYTYLASQFLHSLTFPSIISFWSDCIFTFHYIRLPCKSFPLYLYSFPIFPSFMLSCWCYLLSLTLLTIIYIYLKPYLSSITSTIPVSLLYLNLFLYPASLAPLALTCSPGL